MRFVAMRFMIALMFLCASGEALGHGNSAQTDLIPLSERGGSERAHG
jgi:hypothetical protein